MREAFEETGLEHLVLVRLIGEQVRDMSDYQIDQIHQRYFYHLRCTDDPPATRQNVEAFASDNSGEYLFEFFWVPPPQRRPELAGEQGFMLRDLLSANLRE